MKKRFKAQKIDSDEWVKGTLWTTIDGENYILDCESNNVFLVKNETISEVFD